MNELAGPILWMYEGEKVNFVNNNNNFRKVDYEEIIQIQIYFHAKAGGPSSKKEKL